jgi:hypothetical protein
MPLKQHLRIKAFFGRSENAVKSQIWVAVSVYMLVAIVKKRLALPASLYEILQILSLTLFEKTPVNGLFDDDQGQKYLTGPRISATADRCRHGRARPGHPRLRPLYG